jgi:rhodanese-related sulfurtransferase/rubrerythrin
MQAEQSAAGVKTMFPDDVKELIDKNKEGAYTLLDVRQPFEYEDQHLPGAVLIPLPQLADSLAELDSGKPIVVYCALGGRSRMAARLLANQGFRDVYQLEGGIEAWEEPTATGPREFHLEFIRGDEAPVEVIMVALQMEEGLKRFHELVRAETGDPGLKALLTRLIGAEESHERSLLQLLTEHGGPAVSLEAASGGGEAGTATGELGAVKATGESVAVKATGELGAKATRDTGVVDASGALGASGAAQPAMMEGGVDVNDFVNRNERFLKSVAGYLELAMMIETQALDLYLRMAAESKVGSTKSVLLRIADEEKAHLAMLARFLEQQGR